MLRPPVVAWCAYWIETQYTLRPMARGDSGRYRSLGSSARKNGRAAIRTGMSFYDRVAVMRKFVLFAAVVAVPMIFVAQTPRNSAPLPNEQWVSLFNSKDLTGWVKVGNENWTVEDGTIHGRGVSKQY